MAALAAHAELVTHPLIWAEAERNLRAKRAVWLPGLAWLRRHVTLNLAMAACPPHLLPDKDGPVLGAAIASHCDYLVTGDRTHFGKLSGRTIHGVAIVSPRMLAEGMQTWQFFGLSVTVLEGGRPRPPHPGACACVF